MVAAADQLLAARYQMTLSLGFHIVLSCVGVALPAMIFVVHRRGLRDGDDVALTLAKRWSKVAAVLFAVGAVSGTILSFEMGLLWPGMMSRFGDVIGVPFALEGIAFFVEAIFIGIYLFGWGRLPARTHLYTLIPMMVSGAFGTFCILAVNSWMNAPSGFRIEDGKVVDVDPLAAMFNKAFPMQFLHMLLAAYIVTGFLVASVYAAAMLRGRRDRRHRMGFLVPFAFASITAVVQPLVGHVAGMRLATQQPEKLAAMDLAVNAEHNAPLTLGGALVDGQVRGGIRVPGVGSLLARGGFNRTVQGLNDFPVDERPPVNIVHWSFQAMVVLGTAMAIGATVFWWRRRRGHDDLTSTWALRLAVLAAPAAVVTLELGWFVTEVGRQPWIVYRVMRVRDAVTPNEGVWISLAALVVVYGVVGVATIRVLRSMAARWRAGDVELRTPYGPASS